MSTYNVASKKNIVLEDISDTFDSPSGTFQEALIRKRFYYQEQNHVVFSVKKNNAKIY